MLVYQDKRYRYDRFGRLCEKRIGSNWVQYFEYDAEQRLVCVEQYRSGERERVVFAYDPLGRRISKEVYQRDYPEPRRRVLFHWQGLRLLQEVQSGLASLYVYATPDSYEPLARIDGKLGSETTHYFHTNLAGLPEQLTDSSGLTIWTAHELLQNAWLKNHQFITNRKSGIANTNPAIALQENTMHKNISKPQAKYSLHNPETLKKQSAIQNINRNTAITRRGIYEDLVKTEAGTLKTLKYLPPKKQWNSDKNQ
ncbi:RHS domain-containing protein [Pseudomonas sp. yb_2]|uniref:RHS domain-containing protein n=1 Tax=Pseudomonas sp. yb_2 TaxID=3367218 RepID=UPI00370B2289